MGDRAVLDLSELDVEGEFQVVAIEACPEIEVGPGRVVTAVFSCSRGSVYNLRIEGESDPIQVTSGHPFRSGERGWVPAGELLPTERVLVAGGTAAVRGWEYAGDEPVYNLEVEGDHCYRVGEQGLLVHNASMKNWMPVQVDNAASSGFHYVQAAAEYRGKSNDVALRVGKRNLGRVKYKTKDGKEKWYRPKTFVIGTAGLGKHAEAQIQLYLAEQKEDGYGCGLIVQEVFTERFPCATCSSHFLNEIGENNSDVAFTVYWLAPHGENFESDPGGKELRDTYMGLTPPLFPWPE